MSGARTVWKFAVPPPGPGPFILEMPAGADVLTVQMQHGKPQLWALVNPDNMVEARHFRIAGSGYPITEPITRYVGTFQLPSGGRVFHVFEVAP